MARTLARIGLLLGLVLMATGAPVRAADGPPLVALVIDDLGYRLGDGRRAVLLPGEVTLSFLPHTPHATRLARLAVAHGREVMVHLPMEAGNGKALGPGGLTSTMDRDAFRDTVTAALATLPMAAGVSNHMGSLLTRREQSMGWLMGLLRERHPGLYFVDSRTSGGTVAGPTAAAHGIPTHTRDVFLDHHRDPALIRDQLRRLVAVARREGFALGVGHPYPETLEVLEAELPGLAAEGVRLVPVSTLIRHAQHRRHLPWQLSSSLSPPAARNSKPSPSSTCCVGQESRL